MSVELTCDLEEVAESNVGGAQPPSKGTTGVRALGTTCNSIDEVESII